MPIVYLLIGILLLILLTTVVKLDAFLSFILVAICMGIVTGMDLSAISGSIITGMGNTLGFIAIILGFGAMLGKLISDSGAAQRISITLLNKFGKKHVIWALTTAGFIVGVPSILWCWICVTGPIDVHDCIPGKITSGIPRITYDHCTFSYTLSSASTSCPYSTGRTIQCRYGNYDLLWDHYLYTNNTYRWTNICQDPEENQIKSSRSIL